MTRTEPAGPVRLAGLGNRWRGDDAAGLEAVEALRGRVPASVEVLLLEGDGSDLLDLWPGAGSVVVVDAMRSGAEPGTVRRFDVAADPVPASSVRFSTHTISVPDAVELARALNVLPPVVTVYGIEGAHFEAGEGLSEPVSERIATLCESVLAEIESILEPDEERGGA